MTVNVASGALAAVFASVFLFNAPAIAQEDDGGPQTWGEDARYVSVTFVKFKTGKREEAMEIINEYFKPAGDKAGTPPPMLDVHFQTGPWDAMCVWNLDGGMADLEMYRSENDMKWYAALAELNGGPDGAGMIMERWLQTIRESVTQVGHYHTGEEE